MPFYLIPSDPEVLFDLCTFLIDQCSWYILNNIYPFSTVACYCIEWSVCDNVETGSDWRLELLQDGHPIKYGSCTFRISFCHLNTPSSCCEIFDWFVIRGRPEGSARDPKEEIFISIFGNCPSRAIGANKARSICRGITRSLVRIFVIVLRSLNDFSFILFFKRSKKFAVGKDEHRLITKSFNAFWPRPLA